MTNDDLFEPSDLDTTGVVDPSLPRDPSKHWARTFMFFEGRMREFSYLEDALEAVGCQLALGSELVDVVSHAISIWFFEDDRSARVHRKSGEFPNVPDEHLPAFRLTTLPLLESRLTRHPVLAMDAGPGEPFMILVAPASHIQRFIRGRWKQAVPLLPLPTNGSERWAVVTSPAGTLLRVAVGVGSREGIGLA